MRQLFMQTMAGECGAGGGGAQSTHSVPSVHIGNSEPGLPSSQSLEENTLVSNEKKDSGEGEVAPKKG
jgi:hypothetical protein